MLRGQKIIRQLFQILNSKQMLSSVNSFAAFATSPSNSITGNAKLALTMRRNDGSNRIEERRDLYLFPARGYPWRVYCTCAIKL